MIVDNKPANAAVLHNAELVKSFTIKASAHSFEILSDSLYSNKIRAIIRELGTNAYDSHVSAGKKDVPFEVHLPSILEPYFFIRDYGVGLDHKDVESIFTIYFESTKTDTNDLVGALGLGSKSPFSYTKNFTVTAIKNGIKRIYTAFINEQGVPAIANMGQCKTDESNGIEIKFAVDSHDYDRFIGEAEDVYSWFATKPTILNCNKFKFNKVVYETRDIIPGVHHISNLSNACALMGNILYPIRIPDSEMHKKYQSIMNCNILCEFDIGELDFQANREGLRYSKKTLGAIYRTYDKIIAALDVCLFEQADAITNLWERALFLEKKYRNKLWHTSTKHYISKRNFALVELLSGNLKCFNLNISKLTEWNIELISLNKYYYSTCRTDRAVRNWGSPEEDDYYIINVCNNNLFIYQEDEKFNLTRIKYNINKGTYSNHNKFYVLKRVDKTKSIDIDAFFDHLSNPPEEQIKKFSDIPEAPKKSAAKRNISILTCNLKNKVTWSIDSSVTTLESLDDTATYYYIPLSNYTMLLDDYTDDRNFLSALAETGLFNDLVLYGVRKGDIKEVEKLPNWIKVESYVKDKLLGLPKELITDAINSSFPIDWMFNKKICELVKYKDSDFLKIEPLISCNRQEFAKKYKKTVNINSIALLYSQMLKSGLVENEIKNYFNIIQGVKSKYPLLDFLPSHTSHKLVVEYINLIDSK